MCYACHGIPAIIDQRQTTLQWDKVRLCLVPLHLKDFCVLCLYVYVGVCACERVQCYEGLRLSAPIRCPSTNLSLMPEAPYFLHDATSMGFYISCKNSVNLPGLV
ncbi:hypothetical protein PoB_007555500 [Plakobranchus ocellatus]|uniref:Uncharacterized protein n=1 Tax=Plakobranchus ocellatus TaxID=259542 RepID=A0AAV4DYB2_9GAST|nr:hypothetical protein PoB_007555500 [Plakobranchus ocellatus]